MKTQLLHLLAYEHWANREMIKALEQAGNPPMRALQIMAHILWAQQLWLARMLGEVPFIAIWEEIPLFWMAETADRNHNRMRTFLEGHTDESLLQPIEYQTSQGKPYTNTAEDILMHLSHHAAYHRGQVIQLIRPQLAEAPLTDYIFWVRDGVAPPKES